MKSAAINPPLWKSYARQHGLETDWKVMVREMAAAGYQGVEMHGNEDTLGPAPEMKAFVQDQGLEIIAMGASVTYNPHPPSTEAFTKNVKYMAEAGVKNIMVCGGFMGNQRRTTHDFDYEMFGGNLAAHQKIADDYGCVICFHPHRGCVVETAAETRALLQSVPDLKICVDIAHLEAVADDAPAFIREFADRLELTHIKDYSWESDSFVELGEGDGKLDVAASLKTLADAGYNGWLTVELDKDWRDDDPRTPLDSAKQIREWLRERGY